MIPAVLMLYGPYRQHPWQEDMFLRPDLIQAGLKKLGFGFDIAMVTNAPTGKDEIPEVRIAHDPIYDTTGKLVEAHFRPGLLQDYPSIIDHWVHNFQDEVVGSDGTMQRTAHGIGLPPDRLWNHKAIQTYGNRKDLMNEIIQKYGVGITTYAVLDYEQFADTYGDHPVIFKPQGGSRAIGVEVFATISELKMALERQAIASNGFIQPYLDVFHPLEGLVPATPRDARLLDELNTQRTRPREIRMYVITTTDEQGNLQTETYPLIKVSQPGHRFMKADLDFMIGLDPASTPKGSFIHDKSIELAQAVCHAAGSSGRPIPQYYGVFDWLVFGDIHNPANVKVVDGNCRGPGLVPEATAAREAFQRALVYSGKRQF